MGAVIGTNSFTVPWEGGNKANAQSGSHDWWPVRETSDLSGRKHLWALISLGPESQILPEAGLTFKRPARSPLDKTIDTERSSSVATNEACSGILGSCDKKRPQSQRQISLQSRGSMSKVKKWPGLVSS